MREGVPPKILVIGKNGQVGWELCRTVATLGSMVAMDLPEIDLASPDSIRSTVRAVNPTIVINAAAYTAVDKAESEPDRAMTINGVAPGVLAEEAKRIGAALIHYSTDYVYDGTKHEPYVETDPTAPPNVYGRTKLAGDRAIEAVGVPHLILRTSWIYGWRGQNFLLTMLRLARERGELKVVDDQYGAPTWARYIAEGTAQIVAQGRGDPVGFIDSVSGVYHLTCSGGTTWFGFMKAILEADPRRHEHMVKKMVPIATAEYPTPACRPAWSVLSSVRSREVFGIQLPDWRQPLQLWSHERLTSG